MASYIALLRKESRSDYGVEFPDFPGCVTAGRTLEEARRMAAEALRFHIEGLMQDGERLPVPSPLDAIADDPANDDATAFLVDVPDQAGFVARVNVTIPKTDLRTIDAFAKEHGLTRSGLLTRGALALIAGEAQLAKRGAGKRAAPKSREKH
jgi:predicted RNase H-like HicB family nuclease